MRVLAVLVASIFLTLALAVGVLFAALGALNDPDDRGSDWT